MVLIIALLFTLLSLLGLGWIGFGIFRDGFTVDGLFLGMILGMIAALAGGTALFEVRRGKQPSAGSSGAMPGRGGSGAMQKGLVQSVEFFESHVGEPNKSIVTLSNGAKAAVLLVFEGDLRNALPVGRKVEVTMRKEKDYNVLVNVSYA